MNGTTLTLRTWLTSRRLRVHGLLIGLVLWTVYAWVLATPSLRDRNGLLKGTDFLHFYTLGTLALEHRGADLYDMKAESALAQQRVPQAGHLEYVSLYGPQVSLLFAPLAMLPYAWALTLWLTATVVIYGFCCYEIWKSCSGLQPIRGPHSFSWLPIRPSSISLCGARTPHWLWRASQALTLRSAPGISGSRDWR